MHCMILSMICCLLFILPVNGIAEKSSSGIFWVDEVLWPQGSTQYFLLPVPGSNEMDKVSGFRYFLDLPHGFEVLKGEQYRLVNGGAFKSTAYIYPQTVNGVKEEDKTKYILDYEEPGTNGTGIWLVAPGSGSYTQRLVLCASPEWKSRTFDFSFDEAALASCRNKPILWLLRWGNDKEGAGRKLRECRGVIDIDDFVIKEKEFGRVIFEANFDNGTSNPFSDASGKNGVTLEKENGNGFVRFAATDKTWDMQQSVNVGLENISSDTVYTVSCKTRGKTTKMPDGYIFAPVFIRQTAKNDGAEPVIKCHYEYLADGKKFESPVASLKLKIIPANSLSISRDLDTVLWSSAEESMALQTKEVRNVLLPITKESGIKTHLTEVDFPWLDFLDGLPNTGFRDSLSYEVHRHGMKSVPYVRSGIYVKAKSEEGLIVDRFLQKHPDARAVNAVGMEICDGYVWHRICPEYIACSGEYWKTYLDFLRKSAEKNHWDGLMWDFEMADIIVAKKTDALRCFCPRCIDAFRKYSGISDFSRSQPGKIELPSSIDISSLSQVARDILGNYSLEWLKFRGEQHGRIWKSMRDTVREVVKDARFYLYTGTYRPYPKGVGPWHHCEYYGVYLPAAGRYVDTFMELHYTIRGLNGLIDVEMAGQALKSSGRNVNVLNTVMAGEDGVIPCIAAKSDAVQSVAYTGANGFQIYSWSSSFDSQAWSEVRKGVGILSYYEKYFTSGVRLDKLVSCTAPVDHSVWVHGENIALFIFNNTGKRVKSLKLNLSPYIVKERLLAKNHITGEAYPDLSAIEFDVPASGMLVIDMLAK